MIDSDYASTANMQVEPLHLKKPQCPYRPIVITYRHKVEKSPKEKAVSLAAEHHLAGTPDQPTSRPCDVNREIFDADFLDASMYDSTVNDGLDSSRELSFITDAVNDTVQAITACQSCPILEHCRKLTRDRINENIGPAGVVQAGIYWGLDQQPDFTLNGCVTAASATTAKARAGHGASAAFRVDESGRRWPLTVPVYTRYPSAGFDGAGQGPVEADLGTWDVSWVPAEKPPVNMVAVSLVVDQDDTEDRVIVQAKLTKSPGLEADGREVLTDSDVCEALRIMSRRKLSVRTMAERLGISPPTCKGILRHLGLPVHDSIKHQEAALLREARKRTARRELAATATITHLVHQTQMRWDSTVAGEQLDLCAAAFDAEISRTESRHAVEA